MLTAKTIDLLGVSGVVVLILGGCLGLLQPPWQRLAVLQAQAQTLKQELNLRVQVQAGLAHLQAEVTAIEQRLVAFDQQLPQTAQLETFLRQLDQVAQRTGFTMTMIKPAQVQPGDLYGTLPIAITAEAPFPAFYAFLTALAELPRLTNIDTLTIVRKPEGSMCELTFTLLIYVAKTTGES